MAEVRELSYMSLTEYIETIATWEYNTNPKQFNCKEQVRKIKDPVRIEAFKNRNGCEHRVANKPRQSYENIKFFDCYCNHLASDFGTNLFIYEQYNKGFLPFQGSVLEQPNKVMDVIALIGKLKQERDDKLRESSKK